jgi:hypothetical protein
MFLSGASSLSLSSDIGLSLGAILPLSGVVEVAEPFAVGPPPTPVLLPGLAQIVPTHVTLTSIHAVFTIRKVVSALTTVTATAYRVGPDRVAQALDLSCSTVISPGALIGSLFSCTGTGEASLAPGDRGYVVLTGVFAPGVTVDLAASVALMQ